MIGFPPPGRAGSAPRAWSVIGPCARSTHRCCSPRRHCWMRRSLRRSCPPSPRLWIGLLASAAVREPGALSQMKSLTPPRVPAARFAGQRPPPCPGLPRAGWRLSPMTRAILPERCTPAACAGASCALAERRCPSPPCCGKRVAAGRARDGLLAGAKDTAARATGCHAGSMCRAVRSSQCGQSKHLKF